MATLWNRFNCFQDIKEKASKFQEIIKPYNQYDWGINENFYIAASEALELKRFNLFKHCNVMKFDNDFEAFTEDRNWQIKSWKENRGYLINFLKYNNLSQLICIWILLLSYFKIF